MATNRTFTKPILDKIVIFVITEPVILMGWKELFNNEMFCLVIGILGTIVILLASPVQIIFSSPWGGLAWQGIAMIAVCIIFGIYIDYRSGSCKWLAIAPIAFSTFIALISYIL